MALRPDQYRELANLAVQVSMAAPVDGRRGPTVDVVIPWRIVESIRFELTTAGVDWRRYHPQTIARHAAKLDAARRRAAADSIEPEPMGGWEPRS